jgi:serine protease Do
MKSLSFKSGRSMSKYLISSVIFVFLLSAVTTPAFAQDDQSIVALKQMGKAFAGIAEKASPAVVWVTAEKKVNAGQLRQSPFSDQFPDDDFFKFFFGRPAPNRPGPRQHDYTQKAQASGFIVASDGYILTNNHVVADAEKITVNLTDDREFEATIVGTDPESEVAVIKIDANNLPTLAMGDSDTLEVGEWVLAIGTPFGLTHSVTAGIVSAKGRSGLGLADYENFIQTDAAINMGNSGGPLINLDGKAVGINTAIVGSQGNIGIGLAIPINMAKAVYDQLVESGKVVRGFLGVNIQDLTPKLADSFGLKDVKGVLIPSVNKDSAADKAGIKQGDIIVKFDGKDVKEANELRRRVAMLKPGTKVDVVVLRDGKEQTIKVELGEKPKNGEMGAGESATQNKLGLAVQNLTDELAERLGYKDLGGVVVSQVEPDSLANTAGIRQGMLIMEVNRKPVKNTKDFDEAIEQAVKEGSVVFLINNGNNGQYYVAIKLPKEKP